MRISKPDIIRAQLDGAILLVADEDSYVAAHTIVMACEELLRSWSDGKKMPYSLDWRTHVNPKYGGHDHKFIRTNYNFFKHADRDLDAETDIEPEGMRQWNEIFLLTFVRGYNDLFYNTSRRMRTYSKWMAVQGIGVDLEKLPHTEFSKTQSTILLSIRRRRRGASCEIGLVFPETSYRGKRTL